LPQVVSAQGGIAVFTGRVTIDGAPAPVGTVVLLALQSSGEQLGQGRTGNGGLDPDQYRIDVQQSAVAPGAIVEFSLIDPATGAVRPTLERPTAMNRANFVITTDLSFTLGIKYHLSNGRFFLADFHCYGSAFIDEPDDLSIQFVDTLSIFFQVHGLLADISLSDLPFGPLIVLFHGVTTPPFCISGFPPPPIPVLPDRPPSRFEPVDFPG